MTYGYTNNSRPRDDRPTRSHPNNKTYPRQENNHGWAALNEYKSQLRREKWDKYHELREEAKEKKDQLQRDRVNTAAIEVLVSLEQSYILFHAYELLQENPFPQKGVESCPKSTEDLCATLCGYVLSSRFHEQPPITRFINDAFWKANTKSDPDLQKHKTSLEQGTLPENLTVQACRILVLWMSLFLSKLRLEQHRIVQQKTEEMLQELPFTSLSPSDPLEQHEAIQKRWIHFCEEFFEYTKDHRKQKEDPTKTAEDAQAEKADTQRTEAQAQEKEPPAISEVGGSSGTQRNETPTTEQPIIEQPTTEIFLEEKEFNNQLEIQREETEFFRESRAKKQEKKSRFFALTSLLKDAIGSKQDIFETKQAISKLQQDVECLQKEKQALRDEIHQIQSRMDGITDYSKTKDSDHEALEKELSESKQIAKNELCEALLKSLNETFNLFESELANNSDWMDLYDALKSALQEGLQIEPLGRIGEKWIVQPKENLRSKDGKLKEGQNVQLIGYGWRMLKEDGSYKILREKNVKLVR